MAVRNTIPSNGINAWIRNFERQQDLCIGQVDPFAETTLLEFAQELTFSNEMRALIERKDGADLVMLTSNDFCLFGPAGPLPEPLTEKLQQNQNGFIFVSFINKIIQRISKLYYRSWSMFRPECESSAIYSSDKFTTLVTSFNGGECSLNPHFQWIKPSPSILPLHIEREFSVKACMRSTAIEWLESDTAAYLGSTYLGVSNLGKLVPCYAKAFTRSYLKIAPSNFYTFQSLVSKHSEGRGRLMDLISRYLPSDAVCRLELIRPVDLPVTHLGRSRLSLSQLNSKLSKK